MPIITTAFKRELRQTAFNINKIYFEREQQLKKQQRYLNMPSSTSLDNPTVSQGDIDTFTEKLRSSSRILVICGAGLSASSGLPTFRGAGGYWRKHDATSLATPEAFEEDPSLVWQFYSYRRHMALIAKPNKAHFALAALARSKPEFLMLTQNVDGLSPRAQQPLDSVEYLHGSLYTVKCTNFDCDYVDTENYTDPIVPALAIVEKEGGTLDISDANVPMKDVKIEDLPHCPKCKTSLLRPGVVWFGEALPERALSRVDEFMKDRRGIDLLIVIGTSASVFPAAGYIVKARAKGARVAVVNTETPDTAAGMLKRGDWFFRGDAGELLPRILEGAIGKTELPSENI